MKIPSYLMTELVNRLNRGNVDEAKTLEVLKTVEFVEHEPSWTPMAPNIFSDAMRAELWPMIARHAHQG